MTHTPSFLVWALEQHCPLRQIAHWQDAERTERLLRAARAYDEARAEGRILDGVAFAAGAEDENDLSQVLACRTSEALELYGGEDQVRAACRDCPANALCGHRGRTVAGCLGMWPLPADLDGFCRQVEDCIAADRTIAAAVPAVETTSPGWYGLWLASPLAGPPAAAIAGLLRQLVLDDPVSATGRDELLLALVAAAGGNIPLHVRLYPPGSVEGPWWSLVSHCGRCQAPWTGSGPCSVCGRESHPASPKKRHVRGQRPYRPLVNLLGRENAGEFLVRYRAFRQNPSCR